MTDTGCGFSVIGCFSGISGIDKSPRIDKNLSSDLFCEDNSVLLYRTGLWSGDAGFKIQISGMFRAYTVSSPPEHSFAFSCVVKPSSGNILWFNIPVCGIVNKSTEKEHRTVYVVICCEIFVFLYVIMDFPIGFLDSIIGPNRRFYGCP